MKMSVMVAGAIPAVASDAGNLPAVGPMFALAPASNNSTRSAVCTSSGCTESSRRSVGKPASSSPAATSAGVRPTPKTLLSLGTETVPSSSDTAENSPSLKLRTVAADAAGSIGGPSGSGGGAGRTEHAASARATTDAANEAAVLIVPRSRMQMIRVSYNRSSLVELPAHAYRTVSPGRLPAAGRGTDSRQAVRGELSRRYDDRDRGVRRCVVRDRRVQHVDGRGEGRLFLRRRATGVCAALPRSRGRRHPSEMAVSLKRSAAAPA